MKYKCLTDGCFKSVRGDMKLRERNTVLGKQEEAFKTETGMDATYKIKSSVYHSLVFCKWQASKIATLQAENERLKNNLAFSVEYRGKLEKALFEGGEHPELQSIKSKMDKAQKGVIREKGNTLIVLHVDGGTKLNVGDQVLLMEVEESK
jgi:hypothetical protein